MRNWGFTYPVWSQGGLGFKGLRVYVFTNLSTSPTTSGGNIFRCTTKDIEERRAKGVATPFNPPELMQDIICRIGASRVRIGAPPVF